MQIFDLMEHLRRLKSFTTGLFCEALEEARPSPIDALTVTGAPRLFILAKGCWAQDEPAGLPRRTSSGLPLGFQTAGVPRKKRLAALPVGPMTTAGMPHPAEVRWPVCRGMLRFRKPRASTDSALYSRPC